MSFDDYANHIYQKHRLCIALAVIKSKPPNLGTEEYIEIIKSKMVDIRDEDDITVCSDDFVMDDDESANILQGFNEVDYEDKVQRFEYTEIVANIPEALTQTTFYEESQPNKIDRAEVEIDHNVTFYASQQNPVIDFDSNNKHIKSKNTTTNHELRTEDCKSYSLLGENSKNITKISKTAQNIDSNETTFNTESNISHNKESLAKDSIYDSQKTILYTVHGFTERNTHYSQSQHEIIIPQNYLYAANKNKLINNTCCELQNKKIDTEDTIPNAFKENVYTDLKITQNKKPLAQIVGDVSQNDNETDISPSILKTQEEYNIFNLNSQYTQDINEYFNEIHNINDENNYIGHTNLETPEVGQSQITNFSQNFNEINNFATQIPNNLITNVNQSNNNENNQINDNINENEPLKTQNREGNVEFSQQNNDKHPEMEIDVALVDSSEVIPFKILEEFNKIKIFLNKGDRRMSSDGYSTDSGYKSDSQIRNSNRSGLQSSGASLNQSAYCLFTHIMRCPLLATARDITSEIAQTLAQLIDKLHEEETYPQFLEELLETVDILIRQVYKGRSSEDSEFLNKDEFIQRILLLNKSIHIQKHSIQKITDILTTFHENATDANVTYELTNIDEIENVSYIFHILEILLKNYIKKKDISSQESTQLSQDEEKILKRSSLTDIWRRKWNPNFREISVATRENRCVLKNCSEILNKIIVDCVHSYSLVAFSALNCFNSMQT